MVLSLFRSVPGSRGLAAAILCLAVQDPPLAPAPQGDIEVTGLPKGLTVGVRFELGKTCGDNVGVSLEQTIDRRFEQVMIGGRLQMRQTEHVRYRGNTSADLFNVSGANCNTNTPFASIIVISGRHAGSGGAATRDARTAAGVLQATSPTAARIRLHHALVAKTASVTDVNAQAPPSGTIGRGTVVNWSVGYEDPFGGDSAFKPSLTFFNPAPPNVIVGTPGSAKTRVFRIEIDADNRACLVVGSNRQCGNVNQNVALSVGNVTVTRVSDSIAGNRRNVLWRFRLEQGFTAGQFDVVANAQDREPPLNGAFEYQLPGGLFQQMDILSWRPNTFTVTVQ